MNYLDWVEICAIRGFAVIGNTDRAQAKDAQGNVVGEWTGKPGQHRGYLDKNRIPKVTHAVE